MRSLLEELRREHPRNYGWSLACCAWQRELAEDVLQEAYLRVLEGRAVFAGRSAPRTWFFGVIRLVAGELQRAQRRRALLGLRLVETSAQQEPADLADSAEIDDSARALRLALLQLPERQREVLHLVFYSELTLEQASEVLGISAGSVRTHYHRGKLRLAELLSMEYGDE